MLDVSSESFLRAIFHTLAYADVFEFPLRAPEVYRYLTSTRATLEQVRQVLDSPRFVDKSAGQVWAILLDEGTYLASERTMPRSARSPRTTTRSAPPTRTCW